MSYSSDRRRLLGLWAAVAGVLATSRADAQFSSSNNGCPPGTRLKRIVISTEIAYQERSITIRGIGMSQKVPIRMIRAEIECEAVPPPLPPPPPVPRTCSTITSCDVDLAYLDFTALSQFRADQFFTQISLPSIASLASVTAQFNLTAALANGTTANAAFPMVRDGSGFRFANSGAVDYWASTTGASVIASRWHVSDVAVRGLAAGVDLYTFESRLGTTVLNRLSGSLSVSPSLDGTRSSTQQQ